MNKSSKTLRLLSTALIALLLAGGITVTLSQAMDLAVAWPKVYLVSGAAALLLSMIAHSMAGFLIGSAVSVVVIGAAVIQKGAALSQAFNAVRAYFSRGDASGIPAVGATIAVILAIFLTVLFFVLVKARGGVFFAVVAALILLVGANALSTKVNLLSAIPSLIALAAAFAHTTETDRYDRGYARALVPAVLAVLLAVLLVPAGHVTWAPLETLATDIKDIFDDYFHFTHERVAFTILDEGYDRAAMIGESPTAALGGPASPDPETVMEVATNTDILLRGAIRRDYTGYAWTDETEKARYLYYDFTRTGTRARVFENSIPDGAQNAFLQAAASISMLREGTSSIFAPHKIYDFALPIDTATYYNSVGEMFLSRNVQAGDSYSFSAYIPMHGDALSALVGARKTAEDDGYYDAMDTCLGLPSGVEQGVYDLVKNIVGSTENDYEKAALIKSWLAENCAYSLDVDYPPEGRDFVSYFVLDSREGYCSYYASAMAVMCRIAGLPTRYVEGYSVKAEDDGVTTVTGENAHAWVEVYFNGVGWISFDPTAAAQEGGNGNADTGENDDGNGEEETGLPDGMQNTPTPPPELPEETPSPTPNPLENNQNTPSPSPNPSPPEDEPDEKNDHKWLWILLIILAVLLLFTLLYLWIRARLEKTNPVKLAAKAQSADFAALILYRAILTLLAQVGQTPLNEETPSVFAVRVLKGGMVNPDFAAFASLIEVNRYANKPLSADAVELGARAYGVFLRKLRKREKLRFDITRIFHGLGNFEVIP